MTDQENNIFDDQTPPADNMNLEISHEQKGNDNKKKKGYGRAIAISTISVILAALLCIGSFFIIDGFVGIDNDGENSEESSIYEPNDESSDSESTKPNKKPNTQNQNNGANNSDNKTDYVPPEFDYSQTEKPNLSTTLTEIYKNCSPSCATIRVSLKGSPYSIGSGFVIDAKNGYVATNHHVIENGDQVTVAFYNGDEYEAEIVGSDAVTDLAVLKIKAEGLKALTFGDSKALDIGENVVAIGTPYDESLAGTMTCGIISGIARNVDITNESGKVLKTMTLLQTDCSINPGNSGGPLIDMAGNVIGITSLKLVDEQFEGIGFAIPITAAADIFEKLISGEDIGDNELASAAPQIGVTVYELEAGLEAFGMYPTCDYPTEGVLVADISRTSAAYLAGLSVYDIIVDFDGHKIEDLDDLTEVLNKYNAGNNVKVTVFRFNRKLTDGEEIVIEFKLDAAK